jgi:hypothetical protein
MWQIGHVIWYYVAVLEEMDQIRIVEDRTIG